MNKTDNMIHFNVPLFIGKAFEYMKEKMRRRRSLGPIRGSIAEQ